MFGWKKDQYSIRMEVWIKSGITAWLVKPKFGFDVSLEISDKYWCNRVRFTIWRILRIQKGAFYYWFILEFSWHESVLNQLILDIYSDMNSYMVFRGTESEWGEILKLRCRSSNNLKSGILIGFLRRHIYYDYTNSIGHIWLFL